MKLLVFTDSRGQHRAANQFHDIFGTRLSQLDGVQVDLILCPMKWTTTVDFLEYLKRIPGMRYDHIILYTGIVDWSPRGQLSAREDLYHNRAIANEANLTLNTVDYSKKVVNNKKAAFDEIFGEERMRVHLSKDFGVTFEGQPTINMYSLDMAERYLLPRLCKIENLLFINSNSFVEGWNGDYKRARPANIQLTRTYSELFRDTLGAAKTIDLLRWTDQEVRHYTCDNLHLTHAGSDYIFDQICSRLNLKAKHVCVSLPVEQKGTPMKLTYPLQTPAKVNEVEKRNLLAKVGGGYKGKLATLVIGFRVSSENDVRLKSLLFLLSWIDHYYGDLFDVLLVEQDSVPRFEQAVKSLKPYVRYEFLNNSESYNRGWGYNIAIRHLSGAAVVVCMDTDILPGLNFVDEIVDCHSKYDVISPYTNIYYSDENEASLIQRSLSTDSLVDRTKIKNPTTLSGGILIIRRSIHESVAGFEQYRGYSCEDRALDVTLYNHCENSRIRMAPFTYVHLYHEKDDSARKQFKEIYNHLIENYGCKYDPSLGPEEFIHKNCKHVSRQTTLSNIIKRRASYGDASLYSSGRKLTINGCYDGAGADLSAMQIMPPSFTNLTDYPGKELYVAPEPDTEELSAFYNAYKGQRCFIIGNGPALNKHDLSLLKNEYTFAVNSFYYKTEETGFRPYFFVVEDSSVMKENIEKIKSYDVPFKFFPTNYKNLHPKAPNVFFFRMNRGFYEKSSPNYVVPRFSTDASKVLYCGQSVTYINLQLAFFMGFSEVYLIGMDFNYTMPESHKRTGDVLLSDTDDPNHFHKDYFGKGKTWKDPRLDRVALNYRQAKLSYEAVGRKIYNATIGGELEIFERVSYEALLMSNRMVLVPAGEIGVGQERAAPAPSSVPGTFPKPAESSPANGKPSAPVVTAVPVTSPPAKPVTQAQAPVLSSISYFPIVDNEEQLIDVLSRAAWFLSFCPIDRIYIPVASEKLKLVPWRVAPGLDDSIGEKFATLRKKTVFVVAEKESDLAPCMTEATIILRWKKDSIPDFVSAKSVAAWEKGKKVWQVDPVAVRMEGSYYIEVGLYLLQDREALIQESKAKFERMAKKLGTFKRAYLMATGPSVSRYELFDYTYTDSLSIVCNSVILDEQLMETVRPQILVFADPIFHFGPSQYAAAFRAKLRESAKAHDFTICIPFKYYSHFVASVPELRDRTIAIPFVKDREFNFDLTGEFILRTTANILTFVMIPLATTFAQEIGFLGCDGRPLSENNYFWSHNPNTQFNDKMANIRAVHPGFFAIDYNDYYLEHCGTLEAQMQAGEAKGKRFYSLGFSHIPALKQRIRVGWSPVVTAAPIASPPAKLQIVKADVSALSSASVDKRPAPVSTAPPITRPSARYRS